MRLGTPSWLLSRLTKSKVDRRRQALGECGVVIRAALMQTYDAWWEEDNEEPWYANLLISFDPAAEEDGELLLEAARNVIGLRQVDRRTLPPDWVELVWTLYHRLGPARSLPVPPELCPGLTDCWLATIVLPPHPVWEDDLLRVLALPGDDSPHAVAVLPTSLLEHPA